MALLPGQPLSETSIRMLPVRNICRCSTDQDRSMVRPQPAQTRFRPDRSRNVPCCLSTEVLFSADNDADNRTLTPDDRLPAGIALRCERSTADKILIRLKVLRWVSHQENIPVIPPSSRHPARDDAVIMGEATWKPAPLMQTTADRLQFRGVFLPASSSGSSVTV